MERADFDAIVDDTHLPGSMKAEQNVGKFAPKPGGKFKKPLSKEAKPSNAPNAPNAIEVNRGQVSADFESFELEADPLCHSSTVTRKCDVYQSGSQCSETKTSLQHDSDSMQQDLDLMATSVSPRVPTVKQRDKLQPKLASCLKGPKKKSVSFSLPVETEKSSSHKQGLDSLDLNMTLESTKGNLSNREDSPVDISNEHAEFPDNDEDFECIGEIMDIDSWDEPSIPTKLENNCADKASGGSCKRISTSRAFETDNHINSDSGDMGDLNESKDDDDNWTPNDMNDTKKTTRRKRKSSKEPDYKKIPDNDGEFEPIDEIMNIDSWDEPSIPLKVKNDGADKTSGGSSKRNSTRRKSENVNLTNNDSGGEGDLNESKDDDNWTTNGMNDNKKTSKRKRKSSKKPEVKKVKETKKRIPHGTRRKRKQVDKALLEKLENGTDLTQLPIKDLILIAGAKEKISSKEAAISMPNSNNDSHADHDNPLDEGFDPDSEEAHRHRLKHAKKVNYQTHMKISRSRRWSKEDTELFFEAIREFKTNFGMMVWLFPDRTSRQLKAKFKAEERKRPLELCDALDFRSKDLTLFGKVIQTMKEQKMAEDAAADENEEETGQVEKEEDAGTKSNHKAGNADNNDPWNDGNYDFNESADWELDANVSITQNKEEKVDSEKGKHEADKRGDEVGNFEKKDLWDDDFEPLDLNEFEDLEVETDAAATQFDDKIDGAQ